MRALLNPEQSPLRMNLQAEKKAEIGRRRPVWEAPASAHFLLKICFKVSPACLPQGLLNFSAEREKERERERKRKTGRRGRKWRGRGVAWGGRVERHGEGGSVVAV